jgi:hypothetical protein
MNKLSTTIMLDSYCDNLVKILHIYGLCEISQISQEHTPDTQSVIVIGGNHNI